MKLGEQDLVKMRGTTRVEISYPLPGVSIINIKI